MYENSFTLRRMIVAYAKPLRFTGRSTRTELLGYLILFWLVSTVVGYLLMFAGVAGLTDLGLASFNLVNFLLWLPFPALAVRRFHDQDKSGWWAAVLILPSAISWFAGEDLALPLALRLPLVALYVAALVLLFWKPTEGENRYGPDPRLQEGDLELAATDG